MKRPDLHIITFLFTLLFVFNDARASDDDKFFIENNGQWHQEVLFKTYIPQGELFLTKNGYTLQFYQSEHTNHGHSIQNNIHVRHVNDHKKDVDREAIKVNYLNFHEDVKISGENKFEHYSSFFNYKGSFKANHYAQVYYKNIYPNIDVQFFIIGATIKYNYIIHSGGDINDIIIDYDGINSINQLNDSTISIETIFGNYEEKIPYSYLENKYGKQEAVSCYYQKNNSTISLKLKDSSVINENTLIIDPTIVFSSYSGSTAANFGLTATYDLDGNLYSGSTAFSAGYPIVAGSYDETFNGGTVDVAISKFTSDGSALIYSTYLGGTDNEAPHSLVVNSNNELVIYGTTGSSDFPVSASAYDNSYNGGTPVGLYGFGFNYLSGCDIFISKLSADGTSLLASTYIGGSGNDGINQSNLLVPNYGDFFRGEVIVDDNDNIYLASSTLSSNFPVSTGSMASFQEGVFVKFNNDLSTLIWADFVGGSNDDAAFSVQLDQNNNIFITGATASSNISTYNDAYQSSFSGQVDGYIQKINGINYNKDTVTYIGTSAYDYSYFVQLDSSDNVWVYGVSSADMPVVGAVYSNPNSGQFIQKLGNNLDTLLLATVFGSGQSGVVDISPTAFLVSDCNDIYISGWGGETNVWYATPNGGYTPPVSSSIVTNSSTFGLPLTTDAFQSTTDGSDFYIAVFNPDLASLQYGTFFGGSSQEHVDGGTSRFDKQGKIYHAVCADCAGNNDFPTTPGAWSNINGAAGNTGAKCNLGVFKFDLNQLEALISLVNPLVCLPDSAYFINQIPQNNVNYFWDFGDGVTSIIPNPAHLYTDTITYSVMLVVSDPNGCASPDTNYIDVTPRDVEAVISPRTWVCKNDTFQLSASGGLYYSWFPTTGLISSSNSVVNGIANNNMAYGVIVTSIDGCKDTAYTIVGVNPLPVINITTDYIVRYGGDITIDFSTDISSTNSLLQDSILVCSSCNTYSTKLYNPTIFEVIAISDSGCLANRSFNVEIEENIYVPNTFTPNGDGNNDFFFAQGEGVLEFHMMIFDRWGRKIFESYNLSDKWNGTYNGKKCIQENYPYIIYYTGTTQEEKKLVGHVLLLR